MFIFIKVDTLLDLKADACKMQAHFSPQHVSVCNTSKVTNLLW